MRKPFNKNSAFTTVDPACGKEIKSNEVSTYHIGRLSKTEENVSNTSQVVVHCLGIILIRYDMITREYHGPWPAVLRCPYRGYIIDLCHVGNLVNIRVTLHTYVSIYISRLSDYLQ
jgi:hypothetical protein